jgi:hypothetical protein
MIHIDRLAKRENILNVVKNSGFATFQEYLRVAENRGLLKLNATKTMVGLPGASAGAPNSSTSVSSISGLQFDGLSDAQMKKVNDIARQFASMSSKDRDALARVLKG